MTKRPPLTKSGVEITDEIAEQLADEAERGYDLAQGRRIGRPSLAGAAGASPRLNFRIDESLHAAARERAEREGKTVSEVARDALRVYVAGRRRLARGTSLRSTSTSLSKRSAKSTSRKTSSGRTAAPRPRKAQGR